MPTNDFKAFATGNSANVISQADYLALAALVSGFSSGKASSAQINKALRQSTVMASVLAQFISDSAGVDVLDNGNTTQILANMKAAMTEITSGRLLNVQVFTTNGIYNSTPGTKSIIVEATGGGGGSGGVPATSASQSGVSSAGSSGSFARARYTSNFNGVQVTVGAGGTAGNSTIAGGDGGLSSFGSLLSCPGGRGSNPGIISSSQAVAVAPNQSASPTGSNIIRASSGAPVNNAIQAAVGTATGWYSVSAGDGMNSDGVGASGRFNAQNSGAINGIAGTRGVVVIWEFA